MDLLVSGISWHYAVLWVAGIALLWGWRRLRGDRPLTRAQRWWLAAPLMVLAMVAVVLSEAPGPDHVEHVHVSYLRSLGLMPYTDVFQNHHPALHFIMGALYRLVPPTLVVLDVAAAVSGVLFVGMAAIAVLLARRLWGPGLGLWVVVLLASQIDERQYLTLRPDLAANLLVLLSIWLLATRRDRLAVAASGAALGLAFWFGPKATPFLVLAPAVALSARPLPAGWWRPVLWHYLGLAVSLALFVAWLGRIDLLGPWYAWCVDFNAEVIASGAKTLRVAFPLILTGLAVAGALVLDRDGRLRAEPLARTLLVAAALAVIMGILRRAVSSYDLQLPVLLFAVLAAAPAQRALAYLNARSVLLTAAVLALYFGPLVMPMARGLRAGDHFQARAAMAALLRVAGDEPVVGRAPYHPVVTRDAADLYHGHQSTLLLRRPAMQQRLAGIGPRLRAARPPLVLDRETVQPSIIVGLHRAGIIDDAEAARLRAFFTEGYELRELRFGDQGPAWFWIRKDRLPYLTSPGS